jgi:hypothetical protein
MALAISLYLHSFLYLHKCICSLYCSPSALRPLEIHLTDIVRIQTEYPTPDG